MEDKVVKIEWERLVSEEETCPRCRMTEEELEKAILQLQLLLNPRGIQVVLEKKEITPEQIQKNPLQSNRIIINGRLLEEYINAETGKSPCCSVCGPRDCRTVIINDKEIHEFIPVELIIKASLISISY
ncbi:MAG: DUF2703 domain-containing protein [Candidatus Hydrogenedens sp.]